MRALIGQVYGPSLDVGLSPHPELTSSVVGDRPMSACPNRLRPELPIVGPMRSFGMALNVANFGGQGSTPTEVVNFGRRCRPPCPAADPVVT